jgi:hypothetical protein
MVCRWLGLIINSMYLKLDRRQAFVRKITNLLRCTLAKVKILFVVKKIYYQAAIKIYQIAKNEFEAP